MYWIILLIPLNVILKDANAIVFGKRLTVDKKYLDWKVPPEHKYKGWTCGGAIIHHKYIITSATCVTDGKLVYAIAGYRRYVNANVMALDKCIMETRKKIILIVHPSDFQPSNILNSYNYHYYMFGDICVAQVDEPYNFNDPVYLKYCSYQPAPIQVNFMKKFTAPGTETIALGWGHTKYYRPTGETIDLNEEYPRYAPARIIPMEECTTYIWDTYFQKPIKKFCVCTNEPGNFDDRGIFHEPEEDYVSCNKTLLDLRNGDGRYSVNTSDDCLNGRRQLPSDRKTAGICQNDHGGPLVTWIGGRETLIGVASAFSLTNEFTCDKPFIYSSTVCFNKIIDCFVNSRRSGNNDEEIQENNYNTTFFEWLESIAH
ncbi:uncharacterized protein LOC135083885 isoform X2 [Ostrinia nubilalis]|uniref:uncharacterized protein LOC135083885 isoform X2 n=1 Tax=Ostrinia nubilalis TaxID=29057 RepID=UPI00308237C8